MDLFVLQGENEMMAFDDAYINLKVMKMEDNTVQEDLDLDVADLIDDQERNFVYI